MKSQMMLLVLLFLVSCTSAPLKTSGSIVKERDLVLDEALPKFRQCIVVDKGEVSVELSFKLYDSQAPFLTRPNKIAYNPKTNSDEIVVSYKTSSEDVEVGVDCMKNELRKLSFMPINPSYNYLVHHKYLMNFQGHDVVVINK